MSPRLTALIALTEDQAAPLSDLLRWAQIESIVLGQQDNVMELVAAHAPGVVILDARQAVSGQAALTHLRDQDNWTPVILIGSGDAIERTIAIEEGADDYINMPFDAREVIARVRSILRRAERQTVSVAATHRLMCGPLVLDRLARRVWLDGGELILTPKAFALLEHLMMHPGYLISRDQLLDSVWGWDYPAGIRAVDTRVFELRKALGDERTHPRYIETVPGQGYRFIGDVQIGE